MSFGVARTVNQHDAGMTIDQRRALIGHRQYQAGQTASA